MCILRLTPAGNAHSARIVTQIRPPCSNTAVSLAEVRPGASSCRLERLSFSISVEMIASPKSAPISSFFHLENIAGSFDSGT